MNGDGHMDFFIFIFYLKFKRHTLVWSKTIYDALNIFGNNFKQGI